LTAAAESRETQIHINQVLQAQTPHSQAATGKHLVQCKAADVSNCSEEHYDNAVHCTSSKQDEAGRKQSL
jgi:hypothetical protein